MQSHRNTAHYTVLTQSKILQQSQRNPGIQPQFVNARPAKYRTRTTTHPLVRQKYTETGSNRSLGLRPHNSTPMPSHDNGPLKCGTPHDHRITSQRKSHVSDHSWAVHQSITGSTYLPYSTPLEGSTPPIKSSRHTSHQTFTTPSPSPFHTKSTKYKTCNPLQSVILPQFQRNS